MDYQSWDSLGKTKVIINGDECEYEGEVDEENNPEDAASEAQRHTILKEAE